MILLWGRVDERPMEAVASALRQLGEPYVLLDDRVLEAGLAKVDLTERVNGTLQIGDSVWDLREFTGAYFRPYGVDGVSAAVESSCRLWDWAEYADGPRIVNRASAMASNGSKPYQTDLIAAHGFSTPRTLITTSPERVEQFRDNCGDVIYKSISGVRSIVRRVSTADSSRMSQVRSCPTQFQEHIPGVDYRVHVVGTRCFVCRLFSIADDYRYAADQHLALDRQQTTLPDEITSRCVQLAHALGLPVAGIDLRRAVDGSWVCFEVNPSPGFTFFDTDDGAIARAIAQCLRAG